MDRYRARVILAASALDTYNVIKAYAEHPTRMTRFAFEMLLQKAELNATWSAFSVNTSMSSDAIPALTRLALGYHTLKEHRARSIFDIPETERIQYYKDRCKEAGIQVDI